LATLFQIRRKNIPSANTDELWKCCYECFRELDRIMAEEYTYAYEEVTNGNDVGKTESGGDKTTDAGTVKNASQQAVANGGTNDDKKPQDATNNTESGSKVNSSLNSAAGFKTRLNKLKDWITKALDEVVSKALTLANQIVMDSDPKFFQRLEEAKKKGKKNEIEVENYQCKLDFLNRVTAIIKEAQNNYQNFESLVNNFKNTAGTEGSNDGTANDESFKEATVKFTYEKLHEGLLKGFGVIENQQKAEAASSKGGSSIQDILNEKVRGTKQKFTLNDTYANTCENYIRNSAKANFNSYRDAFNTIKSMRDKNKNVLDTLQQSNSTDNEANKNMISAMTGMSKFLLEITTLCTAGLKLLLEIHVNCKIVLMRYYGFTYDKSEESKAKAKQSKTTGDNNAKG
jgi:hypothetical protein